METFTYYVMAVPKAGRTPPAMTCPLHPSDILASSDAEALEYAESLIDQAIGEFGECHLETEEDWGAAADDERDDGAQKGLERYRAMSEQWQPEVRRVDRPPVDCRPRSWTTDARDEKGRVVGTIYHYGEDTRDQAYDVLIDGAVCGVLAEGNHHDGYAWQLCLATGPLAMLAGRVWPDHHARPWGFVFPATAMADIRDALENAAAVA